ncbi:MAG: prepilin-type N-terminal cleavage/methylation domain-containing protein [Nitrospirae bacterium]|nr:prepilin-type N-terminal cleavage/methylation domain-containing protein [Nitrospirota bacterium]
MLRDGSLKNDYSFAGRTQSGFTLIETMVAIAIMAIGLTTLMQLFSGSLRLVTYSEDYTRAAILAQARMREVMYDKDLQENAFSEKIGSRYMADVNIQQVDKEKTSNLGYDLYSIKVDIKWRNGLGSKSFAINTIYAKKKATGGLPTS